LACCGLAADGPYSICPRLSPGQVLAYDGTYVMQVPSGSNGKNLVLARVVYGLVLRVETVDSQGALVSAVYDRFESSLRNTPPGGPSPRGRMFRFRVTPRGQMEEVAGGGWSPDWSALWNLWSGWPAQPLDIGAGWHTEGRVALAGGGQVVTARDYKLCEIGGQAVRPLAFLDYTERATLTDMQVNLASGRGFLQGEILGVGQVQFELALGLVARAASVSVFHGTLRPEDGGAGSAGQVHLEVETTLEWRPLPPQ